MKILFINPSLRLGSKTKYLPVGVGSVMTYLASKGYDFDLLDIDIDDLSDETVEDYIAGHAYDVVLVGSIVTHYKWIKKLTHTIRRHHPATRIVVGNSVAGSIPEVFLRNSAADVAVMGEGEITAHAVLEAFRDGTDLATVPGIAFRDRNGGVVINERRPAAARIDDFPIIDWSRFNTARYFERSYSGAEGLVGTDNDAIRVMPVVTARGCVFKCTFCHHVYWNDPYRHRSPGSILEEIRRNMDVYGANYINFWDDLSFASIGQAEPLVDAILASGLKFHWNAAVRVDLFGNPRRALAKRKEVAEKFKAAGCLNLGFSLESGNAGILESMNKRVDPSFFLEQMQILREVGITCSTSVVFGYPEETPETIRETFDQCLKCGVYPSIGYLLPLPGTGMYQHAIDHGFITDENAYLDSITERQDLCLNMTSMSDQEVMDGIREGAAELNRMLGLGLEEDRLIKTGGYRRHTPETAEAQAKGRPETSARPLLDPNALKRNENDVSFNYSQATFSIDLGVSRPD